MLKCATEDKIVLGVLIFIPAWVFVALPFYYDPPSEDNIQAYLPIISVATGLLGALIGASSTFLIARRALREATQRQLLSDAMAIQALEEAWILEGYNDEHLAAKLSDYPSLKEKKGKEDSSGEKLWLRRVEVRFVLDEANWHSPQSKPYGFIGVRRAWIVRDDLTQGMSHSGPTTVHYPALISSRGKEELCAWIEQVQSAYDGRFWTALSEHGLLMLRPLLAAVAKQDRIDLLRSELSDKAVRFLVMLKNRYEAEEAGG
jgi:hypothetical protein